MKQERKCIGCDSKTGNNRDGKLSSEKEDYGHTIVTVYHCGKLDCRAVAYEAKFIRK